MIITDQLARMDALVAPWLPGSQGEGVADVLFGRRPPALQARRAAKNLRWERAIAARLRQRGVSEQAALLVSKVALACFQTAYERWVRRPGQDLPELVDESFAALAGLAG